MTRVLQWKYTACEFNIEQANGFYTYSISEGITSSEKEEMVVRLGSYTAPEHLPYQPNPVELKSFPVSFASFRLESGRNLIARTAAVGRDYSGSRWGNFFSHALILENGEWPVRPIELCHDSNFSPGLSESESKIGRKPDPLPVLPLKTLRRDGRLTLEKTYDFLYRSGKIDIGRELLGAVIRASAGGPNIVLGGPQEEILSWMALVQHFFPLKAAAEVSFTSYSHNPLNSRRFLISGTSCQGSAFDFNSILSTRQVEAFDLTSQALRTRPESISLYAKEMITESPQGAKVIPDRLKFFERFEQVGIDGNLEKIAALYGFLFSNIVPENGILAAALSLARERIHASVLMEIVTALAERPVDAGLEIAKTIIRFSLEVVLDAEEDSDSQAPSPERKAAADILVRYLPPLRASGELSDIAELFRFVYGLFSKNGRRCAPICLEAYMQTRKISERGETSGPELEFGFVLGLVYALITDKPRYRTEISRLLANELSILTDPVYLEIRRKFFAVAPELRIPADTAGHACLVSVFSRGNCDELFMKAYIRAFVEEDAAPWKNGRTAGPLAESFLEFYLNDAKNTGGGIERSIRSALVEVLFENFNGKQFGNFRNHAAKYCNSNPEVARELDALNALFGSDGGLSFRFKFAIAILLLAVIALIAIALYLGGIF